MNRLVRVWHTPRGGSIISWGVTVLFVMIMAGVTAWRLQPHASMSEIQPTPTSSPVNPQLPSLLMSGIPEHAAITRKVDLTTIIPDSQSYSITDRVVSRGDSIFAIATEYDLKPETVLWANYDILQDSPDSIRVGQVLRIPPVDGVYYEWKEGDTIESVAEEFSANAEEIIDWPGNNIDLTDPSVAPGSFVMIPGGRREFVQWVIPSVSRSSSSSSGGGSSSACSGGATGSGGFIWPAANHYLSGNDFWDGHQGIDIADDEGGGVWAADSGVVTMAQGGWNYGYGNVVMIDHGNGYTTVYAHLSQINVGICQSVNQGQLIGLSGNTGNSFGAHLHFEIRLGGAHLNPWGYLP